MKTSRGKRVRRMMLVWLLFGAAIGPGSAPDAGAVGLISGILAGMLLLPWLGLVLGLIGGQARQALLGGAWGFAVGLAVALAADEGDVLRKANVALIAGGLIGATFPLVYRLLAGAGAGVLRLFLRRAAGGAAQPGPA